MPPGHAWPSVQFLQLKLVFTSLYSPASHLRVMPWSSHWCPSGHSMHFVDPGPENSDAAHGRQPCGSFWPRKVPAGQGTHPPAPVS